LESQLATVGGGLEHKVRDDFAEITTSANCPGYDAED
jgi:hypothetical protein